MKLVTAEQMRAVDKRAIEGMGIPGLELMENAGRGIAEFIRDRIFVGSAAGKQIAIFCGAGNNGGDGYVVARYLHSWGASPRVFLLVDRENIQGDALVNLQRLADSEVEICTLREPSDHELLSEFDLIIDAIFGTGFHGQMLEPIRSTVEMLNRSGVPIISIDTPSGTNIDSGQVGEVAVQASFTTTLALPKLGHYFYPIRRHCGYIEVIDIGIPHEAISAKGFDCNLITSEMVGSWIPERQPTAHKGDCGKLFLIAGSVGLTGAAVLAADSAIRAGAGQVKVGTPASLNDILETKLTEAMTKPLPELRKHRCLALRSLGVILQELPWADSVCVGPGLGRHRETMELTRRLVNKLEIPAVLDADALFAFSNNPDSLRKSPAPLVLTPHLFEFSRLTGKDIRSILENRIRHLREYADVVGKVVLLKGAPTLIADPAGEIYLSETGNNGMATGGAGDVLTGLIGALLAYGVEPIFAAAAGAYLHGLAGDIAVAEAGSFGLIAGDIVSSLPEAFIEILQ